MIPKNSTKLYHWEGLNRAGENITGFIEGPNLNVAKNILRNQGIIVKKLVKKRRPWFAQKKPKIRSSDILLFVRQLATMLKSGIPLIQALDIVIKGQKNHSIQELILGIKKDLEQGLSFSASLALYPKYFSKIVLSLIAAGEQSGNLDLMLEKITSYKEKLESIKKKIKKALRYPTTVVTIALIVTVMLLIVVVPQFESLFKSFGAELPLLTQIVVRVSKFFQTNWYLILSILIFSIIGILYLRKRSLIFAISLDKLVLKLPICGSLIEKAALARFAQTLAITFKAGIPLVDALKSVQGVTGNLIFANATTELIQAVSNGQQLHIAMENTQLFSPMLVQMVGVGEESGNLEYLLSKAADFYENEVDAAIDRLGSLLEPIIMCILGTLIGILVIAMYLPIFKLGTGV